LKTLSFSIGDLFLARPLFHVWKNLINGSHTTTILKASNLWANASVLTLIRRVRFSKLITTKSVFVLASVVSPGIKRVAPEWIWDKFCRTNFRGFEETANFWFCFSGKGFGSLPQISEAVDGPFCFIDWKDAKTA